MESAHWAERFPALFTRSHVEYAASDVVFSLDPVERAAVTRLHLIACTAPGLMLVCRSVEGWRFLPGGQREPDESLRQLAARELREEAGAELIGELTVFGAHVAVSHAAGPHREHWPHPRSLWAYAVCRAQIVGEPTMPADGEVITDVVELHPAAAVEYLAADDPLLADVVALAVELGLIEHERGAVRSARESPHQDDRLDTW